jgi:CTP:molybdopterin cytidylyltransferase MocA
MGAFKPLLPFGDKTVIECCVDYLREGGAETIVAVLGHRANEIRDFIKNVTIAINSDPASQMGASIAIGVQALPATMKAVVISLVDHPAVPATVVAKLIEEWQNGASIVIPTWQDRGGHPVLVDLALKNELLNLDRSGGLRALFKKHGAKRLPVDSPFVARDMDTWDDYCALYEEAVGEPPPSL